ncbi:MAG TPA: antitoxin [Actinospica sp.]|nr:antitoxin [Actinospica sp.]
MSVLEMVKTKVKELTDPDGPANELLHTAKSSIAHGLDGAGKFVDEKTGGKYSSMIHNSVGKAKEFLGEQPKNAAGDSASAPADSPPENAAATAVEGAAPAGDAAAGGPAPASDTTPQPPEPPQSPASSESPASAESPKSSESGEPPQPQA